MTFFKHTLKYLAYFEGPVRSNFQRGSLIPNSLTPVDVNFSKDFK